MPGQLLLPCKNTKIRKQLQIYNRQIPLLLSITHRGTGIFLSVGALLLSYWLLAIADGPQTYARVLILLRAWYGKVLLVAVVFSLYYHLCNGVIYLFQDAGISIDVKSDRRSGYVMIAVTLLLTIATCALAIWSA